jgi:hypothetical protein
VAMGIALTSEDVYESRAQTSHAEAGGILCASANWQGFASSGADRLEKYAEAAALEGVSVLSN